MDKQTNINSGQQLVAYNILISILSLFVILIIILYVTNKDGFTKTLGYEIFITIPVLIFVFYIFKQIILLKQNPSASILSSLPFSTSPLFPIGVIMVLLVTTFFAILGVGGFYSNPVPENNTSIFINLTILLLFTAISGYIYYNSTQKDDKILQQMPRLFNDINSLRTKYTAMFIAFIIGITLLYFFNPYGIMTAYGGISIFFTLFIGMIFLAMILIYQFYIANPSKLNLFSEAPKFSTFFKGIYIVIALALSGLLIYGSLNVMGVFNQNSSSPNTIGHTIFNIFLFCVMLGLLYKLVNAGGFLDKNPLYRLILNTLLYIPCLLVIILHKIFQLLGLSKTPGLETPPTTKFEIIMLVLGIVLIFSYVISTNYIGPYLKSKYYKQGGEQIINQPIRTDNVTNVASYQTLGKNDKFNYQYAMSFWFYIDSFPPSTNNKVFSILSYGENPCIKYNSSNNSLIITVKQNTGDIEVIDYVQKLETTLKPETINLWKHTQDKIHDTIEKVKSMSIANEYDADGNRILYTHPDIKLQKWNNLVINYNGGTLDVFYNGKLVKSAIEVVPYLKFDMLTVGSQNGISGNVANLIYFNSPLDITTINTLYSSLKNKNPPSIADDNIQLVPLPNII